MRINPTKAEEMLWQKLKGNKNGYHFRQQHIINKFIADFVCLSKNLIIEIDGDIHDLQIERDQERTRILKQLGFEIIRFKNEEVLENVDSVVQRIVSKLDNLNEGVKVLPFGEDLGGVSAITHPLTPSQKEGEGISIRLLAMLEHTKLFEELLGGTKNFAIMKKHYKAYVNNFPGSSELRGKLMEAANAGEVESIVNDFLSEV
jgi:very-short-patch-repair endonuclease